MHLLTFHLSFRRHILSLAKVASGTRLVLPFYWRRKQTIQLSKLCMWLTQTECSSYRPFFKSPSWLLPVYSILYEESFCSQVNVRSAKFKMAECHSIRYYDNISSPCGFISAVLHIIIMKILILVLSVHSCTFRVNCACKSSEFSILGWFFWLIFVSPIAGSLERSLFLQGWTRLDSIWRTCPW